MLAKYAFENLLQIFKPNLKLFNEIIYAIATAISPVIMTHEENNFKQPKRKLSIQKEIKEYSGDITRLDKLSEDVKVKTRYINKN